MGMTACSLRVGMSVGVKAKLSMPQAVSLAVINPRAVSGVVEATCCPRYEKSSLYGVHF